MRASTVIFFLALILTAIYYGLLPSTSVRLKGIHGETVTEAYRVWLWSRGSVEHADGIKVQYEPPYEFVLRVLPEDERVEFVELADILVYACGTTTKLYTYDAPLVHTVDYFDYKKPLAYYQLTGRVPCHGNMIMDVSFILRDSGQQPLQTIHERVLAQAYERTPSTLGYWWSMVWDR